MFSDANVGKGVKFTGKGMHSKRNLQRSHSREVLVALLDLLEMILLIRR